MNPIPLDPRTSALVAIDMHRGHLDPSIETMPLPAERVPGVISRAAALFDGLRAAGMPIVHVVTEYRRPEEIAANPFWKAISGNPSKARRNAMRHNLQGSPGTEIIPALLRPQDIVVRDKKRYSPFHGTNLEFVLRSRGARTLVLAGINTSSCVLNCAFDATNRDFAVVIAKDAVDSMDGLEMHEFALRLMAATCGWPLSNEEILSALTR